MPCFNHESFVVKAISSVLNQTWNDLELIVVDDCSKDDSVQLARTVSRSDSRLKLLVHETNSGASASRNDALSQASGEFIAFCDADDMWKSDKLQKQMDLLRANPQFDLAYCDSEFIDERDQPNGELFSHQFPPPSSPSGDLFLKLCFTNFINMQTVLVRRTGLGSRLLFDGQIRWVEDWWLWICLSQHHKFLYDPAPLALYRVHPNSSNRRQKVGIARHRWKVTKRILRTCHALPSTVKARLWYQAAIELDSLKHHCFARRSFGRSLSYSLAGANPGQAAKSAFRYLQSIAGCATSSPFSQGLVRQPLCI